MPEVPGQQQAPTGHGGGEAGNDAIPARRERETAAPIGLMSLVARRRRCPAWISRTCPPA